MQGRDVLRLLYRASGHALAVRALRAALARPGASSAVVRASVSRTLRRLWRAGVIELIDDEGVTLTTRVAAIQCWAQTVRATPAVAYRAYVAYAQKTYGPGVRLVTVEDYAASWRAYAAGDPVFRAASIALTAAGLLMVNTHTPRRARA